MDYLGKGEMLTNRDVNKFVPKIWEKEHSLNLLFQLMKHETNTLHVYIFVLCITYCSPNTFFALLVRACK